MEVKRRVKILTKYFEVGDQITVPFQDREYTATAIQTMEGGQSALFLTDDFLDEAVPMNKKAERKAATSNPT